MGLGKASQAGLGRKKLNRWNQLFILVSSLLVFSNNSFATPSPADIRYVLPQTLGPNVLKTTIGEVCNETVNEWIAGAQTANPAIHLLSGPDYCYLDPVTNYYIITGWSWDDNDDQTNGAFGTFSDFVAGFVTNTCPAPAVLSGNYPNGVCIFPDYINPKGTPAPEAGGSCSKDTDPNTNKPISMGYGNKFLHELDYSENGTSLSAYQRTYNSTSAVYYSNQGLQWRNALNRAIQNNSSANLTFSYRPGGKVFTFTNPTGTSWLPDADITDRLVELKDTAGVRTGWTYTVDSTGEVETYDANGKLLSIKDRANNTQSMTYSCKTVSATCPVVTPDPVALVDGLLIKVTDQLGRSLNFSYDNLNRIKTMTNPAGGSYTYTYSTDGSNNLTSVTYPDNKTKTYLYGEAANVSTTPNAGVNYANALTGIIDENNNRYATYRYDAAGRAYDEEIAPNLGTTLGQQLEHNNLVYNVDANGNPTNTVVTDARGSARTYNFTTILGVVKSTGQSQPGGSGCSASSSAITYDANGNVSSRTDFAGHQTTYVYDLSRNLETSRTEGLTTAGAVTPATRTITTTWHPTWRLPLVTTTHTGGASATGVPTGAALHKVTNVYDTKGNITSITENDPVLALNRVTTITYTYSTAVPGLVLTKVVNGPRTDVTDTTTYNYFAHNATCVASSATPIVDPITGVAPANLGCRGQLQTLKNALNQTTTFNRYNHHGQVEQMTDANGLVTTNTYDLRQRLLTRTVSGAGITAQVTTLTYDNAGQVTQLKMPDNSSLTYTYDAAHRLTDIQDTLGNKVHYTLDASGNRIQEDTKDPAGVLAKTLTRSYDALNRLQQVTGVE